jgi:hypothetical protein
VAGDDARDDKHRDEKEDEQKLTNKMKSQGTPLTVRSGLHTVDRRCDGKILGLGELSVAILSAETGWV